MIKLEGDKLALYQWDLNQRVILVNIDAGIEVHFSSIYDTKECCLIAPSYKEDGVVYADVPNKLLQESGILSVWLFVQEENKAWTEHKTEILVIARNRPPNYVYTETEIMDYKVIAREATKRLDETEGFAQTAENAAKAAEEAASEAEESAKEANDFANNALEISNSANNTANEAKEIAAKTAEEYVNPVIEVEAINNGYHVKTIASNGEHNFDILNGAQGPQGIQGEKGHSPEVSISKSDKTTTIEIVDAFGTHTATINDGEDGESGGVNDYNDLSNTPIRPFPVHFDERVHCNYVYIDELEENVFYWIFDNEHDTRLVFSDPNYNDGRLVLIRDFHTYQEPLNFPCRFSKNTIPTSTGSAVFFSITDGVTMTSLYKDLDADGNLIDISYGSNSWPDNALIRYNNTLKYTPTDDYNPASKLYVDNAKSTLKRYTDEKISEQLTEFANSYVPPFSNWKQNDPAGVGYIKNRTHYEEIDTETATNKLTWDGVIGDRLAIPLDEDGTTFLVKISDSVPTVEDFIGGSLTIVGMADEPQTLPLSENNIGSDNGMIAIGNGAPFLAVMPTSNNEIGIPAGTYSIYSGGVMYVSKVMCVNPVFGDMIVHKLPEKYIPEMSSITLISSGGMRFKVTVDDNGTLSATEIVE